ncbi:spore germination protein [Priestia koreensis]|uniref:spore germination protein n=1 Tax=Priestia koreensis TaxID=284581 RepID=UPI003459B7FD
MKPLITINGFCVQTISRNANINFGATRQESHTANNILIGNAFSVGNYSPVYQRVCNRVSQRNVQNQTETGQAVNDNNSI